MRSASPTLMIAAIRAAGRATALAAALVLAGCGPDYSPNTYSSSAVQQAAKVEQATVVGVRAVGVSASGAVGAATGAAVGGIAGAQAPGGNVGAALGAVGGGLVGGLLGSGVEHATGDTTAFEYIVRKSNGDLLSVTQKDDVPLALGTKVLVIAGSQARIVRDYTASPEEAKPAVTEAAKVDAPTHADAAPRPAAVAATPLAAPPPLAPSVPPALAPSVAP